jgi:hypothetical protein
MPDVDLRKNPRFQVVVTAELIAGATALASADRCKLDNALPPALPPHQLAAAAEPARRTSDLLGNFGDFDSLFEQLGQPALIELGKPLPNEKYMPSKPVGSCPAAHNQALLDKGPR